MASFGIEDNEVIGPAFRRAREKGWAQGWEAGIISGREEGMRHVLRHQIEKRFGSLPAWAEHRLSRSSESGMEDLALKILDSRSLRELFAGSDGTTRVMRLLIEKRFGPLPDWVEDRLVSLSQSEAEDLAARILDAQSLQGLFEI